MWSATVWFCPCWNTRQPSWGRTLAQLTKSYPQYPGSRGLEWHTSWKSRYSPFLFSELTLYAGVFADTLLKPTSGSQMEATHLHRNPLRLVEDADVLGKGCCFSRSLFYRLCFLSVTLRRNNCKSCYWCDFCVLSRASSSRPWLCPVTRSINLNWPCSWEMSRQPTSWHQKQRFGP